MLFWGARNHPCWFKEINMPVVPILLFLTFSSPVFAEKYVTEIRVYYEFEGASDE